jgi:tRNA (cmo5U34)-methyltransferase
VTVNLWSEASHARDYLERRQSIPHRDEGYAAVLEFLPPAPRRVLDLGTGDGELLARIRAVHPDADGVAADFSAEMLERARARFAADPAVTVVEHDLNEALPDAWGTFDVVVSSFAIHHVDHRRKRGLYREVRDRLEPGGVFCNLEHVDSATPELHEAFLVAIGFSRADDDPSNQLLDVGTQLAWLRELGFEQVDCHWKWRELALLAGVKAA